MRTLIMLVAMALAILAAALGPAGQGRAQEAQQDQEGGQAMTTTHLETAVFAGGCFWCLEADFENLPGVVEAVSGYAGGHEPDPTYDQVSAGGSGHLEAVQVRYDPSRLTYDQLLDWFWRRVDPTDPGGSFVDRGARYRSAIFWSDQEQRARAEASRAALAASGRFERPIATDILPLTAFYPAEDQHQDFCRTNPTRYHSYRGNSGRDRFLDRVWGRRKHDALAPPVPSLSCPGGPDELRARLTPEQYEVTQEQGTERAFANAYWDNKAEGIYVDVVSGEPLFSSLDKYDSGTGWPSFTRPLEPGNIVEREDRGLFTARTEARSRLGDSHLGHVFDDGPQPLGRRWCMNSAALRFVPRERLEAEGYGRYLRLFR